MLVSNSYQVFKLLEVGKGLFKFCVELMVFRDVDVADQSSLLDTFYVGLEVGKGFEILKPIPR